MLRAAIAAFLLSLTAAIAQEEGFRVLEQRDPPRGADHAALQALARPRVIETEVTYIGKLQGDLADGPRVNFVETDSPGEGVEFRRFDRGVPAIVIIALLLTMLALWMRFGGSGALLAAAPKSGKPRQVAPESWALSEADQIADPRSLLEQIAAMPDRRAAMVRLLHHCLLFAGEDSDTRFARADTERDAFRRLPQGWRFRQPLGGLLRATELAHYGGRMVDEGAFAEALETGRVLLNEKGPAHA